MADFSPELESTALTLSDPSTTLSTTLDSSQSVRLDITREDIEKRQLHHSIQLLKLELSQKSLLVEALKNEQSTEVEELQERLSDAQHENKLLKLRLQSMNHTFEEETKRLREKSARELAMVAKEEEQRQQSVTGEEGGVRRDEVEAALQAPQLTEGEYLQLHTQDPAKLSLNDFIRVRCYELTQLLQRQCSEQEQANATLSQNLTSSQRQLEATQERLVVESGRACSMEERCSQLSTELTRSKTQVLDGNYKVDNFDALKRERDGLRGDLECSQRALLEAEATCKASQTERDQAFKELGVFQQSLALLRQDKEYLTRQTEELSRRASAAEERAGFLSQQLADAKTAQERLYQQMVQTKEEQRAEHERRLQQEVEGLKARTALELDQLKAQTREMYERESRSLCEARDQALSERNRAVASEKETRAKYESLLKDYHQAQVASESRLAELQGELQLKQFECERVGLVTQETSRDLKQSQLACEKLQKKVGVLTEELWTVQSASEGRERSLGSKVADLQERLDMYEKLEKELDDIVLQSAEMEHDCDAEKVLFSYGFGTSVPSNSRRRLQQSVQLARRVLQLEKINSSLRREMETDRAKIAELKEELSSVQDLLSRSEQPYRSLLGTLQEREGRLREVGGAVSRLEGEIQRLQADRARLMETKNQMAADLERLLSHREELNLMKQLVLGSQAPHHPHHPHHPSHPDTTQQPPPPTLFTKQAPPSWLKLRQEHHTQPKV